MKNYNNELEIILEKKSFSVDVKNILLNMLYKIETSYEDYFTVNEENVGKRLDVYISEIEKDISRSMVQKLIKKIIK